MRIDQTSISKMINSYKKSDLSKTNKSKKNRKKDQLFLSEEALQLQKSKVNLNKSFAVDKEKVSRIKEQLKQGNYNVSGEDIAKKMLNQVINKSI
ncbi:flagellar biosynthesis anti-sigma factor FlgM [Orenia marismortui]|uniref:Negative regulator of flagellin synthesis n=1 Tax=Orenia marismortui TaxID=46469 RepID=A0A4R8HKX1_9FIRM|nr:flagellar biosynthesis anti-sigma factor FlgM [Orenia marismortui]TDX58894.1 FlgM family anti-sigma-28 factor [Orenia marismortui]